MYLFPKYNTKNSLLQNALVTSDDSLMVWFVVCLICLKAILILRKNILLLQKEWQNAIIHLFHHLNIEMKLRLSVHKNLNREMILCIKNRKCIDRFLTLWNFKYYKYIITKNMMMYVKILWTSLKLFWALCLSTGACFRSVLFIMKLFI